MNRRSLLLVCACLLAAQLVPAVLDAQTPPTGPGKIRLACVGDSITYGSGLSEREVNSYPAVLQKLLGEGYDMKNFGVSGATLLKNGDKPYWKQSAFKAATEFDPNIVIIKLGTNDTKPQNWSHKEEFAADLRALVDHFSALPAKPKLWLCLPVPVHKPNFGINQPALDEELPMIRRTAAEKHTGTIDLFTALKLHPEMFRDGIHPNADGAAIIAQTVQETLESAAAPK